MEIYSLLIVLLIGLIVVRRYMRQRSAGPEATVRALLRRYDSFRKAGLSERQAQMRLLSERRGWKDLPEPFLKEIVARLGTKEELMRFVTLVEGYDFIGEEMPNAAANDDIEAGIFGIACVLGRFGNQLQQDGQLKQAEFVQKLALRLQPNQYFTNLPLAITYFKMERYDEAVPKFKRGLAQLQRFQKEINPPERVSSVENCHAPHADTKEFELSCKEMYAASLKATGRESRPDAE